MPVPAVYGIGHALMGEGYERFKKCGDVELENLLHFLSIVLCGSGGEKKGTRTSAPKTSGEDGGGEEFSAWGSGGNPEKICAEKNVG